MSGESVGEVRIVSDMHERKAAMAREAEAFIALPGSYLNNPRQYSSLKPIEIFFRCLIILMAFSD